MYYVYILRSLKTGRYYKGYTTDLDERLKRHNSGLEKYTASYRPWEIIWHCTKPSRKEAMLLEKKLKNITSRKKLESFILKYTG